MPTPNAASPMERLLALRARLNERILGQETLIDELLTGLLSEGHLLIEGPPGVAKTSLIKTLAGSLGASFQRIQFTPDLLPSDITGGEIYRPKDGQFELQKGPLFHEFILADEINRAGAKVQSALLEAMEERQVTLGQTTLPLGPLFMVFATQNPLEHEGTYPLPEAQLDRFMMKLSLTYARAPLEGRILSEALKREEARLKGDPTEQALEILLDFEALKSLRLQVLQMEVVEEVDDYIVSLITATRSPASYDKTLSAYIEFGASPRGTIALGLASRAYALLQGRTYVLPKDVKTMALPTLRHRIHLSAEAALDGLTPDECLRRLIERLPSSGG